MRFLGQVLISWTVSCAVIAAVMLGIFGYVGNGFDCRTTIILVLTIGTMMSGWVGLSMALIFRWNDWWWHDIIEHL